ncbi:hypothetical protein BC835DRAFT_1420172 [Cytidiella melzeri]|nr:hypothetical protein BC835DRAFT_1420172 [Cytidiella melzeri]
MPPVHVQDDEDLEELDDDNDERHEDEDDPLLAKEQLRVDIWSTSKTGPLGRTSLFMNHLKTMPDLVITQKLINIIKFMADVQMDTTTFLHYLSWNLEIPAAETSIEGTIRYARTALMHSEQLPGILHRWYKPPRPHQRGVRTRAARAAMDVWALNDVTARINREMRLFAR